MKMKNYILILIVILSFVLPAETKQSEIPEIKYESLDINGNKNYMVSKPVFIDNVKFKDINDKINKLIDKKTLEKESQKLKEILRAIDDIIFVINKKEIINN